MQPFLVERWLNRYEQGVSYNLAETDAYPYTLAEIIALGGGQKLVQEMLDTRLGYNVTPGSDALRGGLASLYNNLEPGDILVTTGAMEADFALLNTLVEPGDEVVVQTPAYQVLTAVAEARGARVKYWEVRWEDGFEPDLTSLQELLDSNTRLLVLNSPHNPTGAVLVERDMLQILDWAEQGGFRVLVDEVYRGIAHGKEEVAPAARDLSTRAISVGSLSKTFGLSGLRVGWLAADPDLVEACWGWKDYTTISISPLSDLLARAALEQRHQVWERSRSLARVNLERLGSWLEELGPVASWVPPQAGLVCFPRLEIPGGTREFCRRAAEERGVLLVPGECFNCPGHIRFGIGGDPDEFAAGLDQVRSLLEEAGALPC